MEVGDSRYTLLIYETHNQRARQQETIAFCREFRLAGLGLSLRAVTKIFNRGMGISAFYEALTANTATSMAPTQAAPSNP